MATSKRHRLLKKAVKRGKYAPLYDYLLKFGRKEWQTTFADIEAVLGFELPDSARIHRPWWANQGESGGHSHALAWKMAGWKTSQVHLGDERLVFVRGDDALEIQFDRKMIDIHDHAAKECRYEATDFIQMMNDRGGTAAARALLHSSKPDQGLTTLWERGRLDLSVEAQVCHPKWQDLFTEEEIAIAEERLRGFGYSQE